MTKLPVLDSNTSDATVIGHASNETEASEVLKAHYASFSSAAEMQDHEEYGLFVMTKRVSWDADDYDAKEELKNGFFDNA